MHTLLPALLLLLCSCHNTPKSQPQDSLTCHVAIDTSIMNRTRDSLHTDRMVQFAQSLIGTPYHFGCTAPSTGFDCSGFISYVFSYFHITVPRSSVDFTNIGLPIPLALARAGDLILFTGTDCQVRKVGHIGMILTNTTAGIHFIHASSGKDQAVTISPLNEGYRSRFVKIIRISK